MAEPQATREKEGAGRKILLQASQLIIHPKEIFCSFPCGSGSGQCLQQDTELRF